VKDDDAAAAKKPRNLSIIGILRPYWKGLSLALLAVAAATAADLLETLASQDRPRLPAAVQRSARLDARHRRLDRAGQAAVLKLRGGSGWASSPSSARSAPIWRIRHGQRRQWVMHDLRRTLYHHIQRLSLAEHDEKRTGDSSAG